MTVKTQRLLGQLATALVCLVMLIAFLISGIRLFGFQVYGVLSGSMEPTYPTGSLIYVRKVDPSDLQLRDVITFQVSGSTIATHRIVEIVPDVNNPASRSFRTQGDANDTPDANLVSPASIIGRVSFCIPHMGNLASYIQSPGGTVVTIILCLMLVVFVFYTDTLDKNSRRSSKRGRRTSSGGSLQRILCQLLPASGRSSHPRKRQTDRDYMHQEYRPQEQTLRASSQRSGSRQGYYDARYGYSRRASQPRYDQRGYAQQCHPQSGYPRQSHSQQGYSEQRYVQQSRAQAQYQQPRHDRQVYPRQEEARRGYAQSAQRPRTQQRAQSSANRAYRTGTQAKTNPHSWSYRNDQ